LIRLRIYHPLVSVLVGCLAAALAAWHILKKPENFETKRISIWVIALVAIQLAAGAVNVLLLAPIWMQLVHLFLADLLWMAIILLAAASLSQTDEVTVKARNAESLLETAEV
jgi:heme A synthase